MDESRKSRMRRVRKIESYIDGVERIILEQGLTEDLRDHVQALRRIQHHQRVTLLEKEEFFRHHDLGTITVENKGLTPEIVQFLAKADARAPSGVQVSGTSKLSPLIPERDRKYIENLDLVMSQMSDEGEPKKFLTIVREALANPKIPRNQKDRLMVRAMAMLESQVDTARPESDLTPETYAELSRQAEGQKNIRLSDGRRFLRVDPDDKVHLRGGEKFVVTKKTGSETPLEKVDPRAHAALNDLLEWNKQAKDPVLQVNECSRLHKLMECVNSVMGTRPSELVDTMPVSFVVKHDWAAAFKDSLGTVADSELKLPYPVTAFEFKISGRVMIVMAFDPSATNGKLDFQYFVKAKNKFWIGYSSSQGTYKSMRFALDQVRAICVMLDSHIAETTVIRQPFKLQEKRRKAGKPALNDYHVIDLSKRHLAQRAPASEPSGRHMRCHFRRGHWRHYVQHKTWINWTIVGDPDLGFVEKEYRL